MLMGKEDWEAIKVDGQPITPPPNGIESIGSEWKKAQWYETEHLVKKIDLSGREGAVGKGALFLPPPNEFIPTNFEVDKKTGIEVCPES
jgi:secreted Zn-dependent insulinase-like peptidase